jgi:hypothetical protein
MVRYINTNTHYTVFYFLNSFKEMNTRQLTSLKAVFSGYVNRVFGLICGVKFVNFRAESILPGLSLIIIKK